MAETDCSTKACSKCKAIKPLDDFHRMNSGSLTGRIPRCKACMHEAYLEKKAEAIARAQKHYAANKEQIKKRNTERYWNRRAEIMEKTKAYQQSPKGKEKRRAYFSQAHCRINNSVRLGIRKSLIGGKRGRPTWSLLGYSLKELTQHLERQFTRGMSWENYGQWEIDHILPLASFKIDSPDSPELKRAWALTNLRPLWREDNRNKSDKIMTLL